MPKEIIEKLRKKVVELSCSEDSVGQLYTSLFEDSHSVMLIIRPETGEIIDANNSACKYYQYSQEQLTKMLIYDINILAPNQIKQEMINAKTEKRNYFNFQHRLANDEIKDVEVYSSPIILSGQEVLYSIIHDVSNRKAEEKEREKLIADLKTALSNVKILSGLLPICASCKKIRDDKGYWNELELYLQDHSDANFTHGICPDCAKKLYPDYCKDK